MGSSSLSYSDEVNGEVRSPTHGPMTWTDRLDCLRYSSTVEGANIGGDGKLMKFNGTAVI